MEGLVDIILAKADVAAVLELVDKDLGGDLALSLNDPSVDIVEQLLVDQGFGSRAAVTEPERISNDEVIVKFGQIEYLLLRTYFNIEKEGKKLETVGTTFPNPFVVTRYWAMAFSFLLDDGTRIGCYYPLDNSYRINVTLMDPQDDVIPKRQLVEKLREANYPIFDPAIQALVTMDRVFKEAYHEFTR